MHERSPYGYVELFILKLEENKANPPPFVEHVHVYCQYMDKALVILNDELDRWVAEGRKAEQMTPSHLSEPAAEAVCEALRKAAWHALITAHEHEVAMASAVLVIGEPPVAESGVVSTYPEQPMPFDSARVRQGRS